MIKKILLSFLIIILFKNNIFSHDYNFNKESYKNFLFEINRCVLTNDPSVSEMIKKNSELLTICKQLLETYFWDKTCNSPVMFYELFYPEKIDMVHNYLTNENIESEYNLVENDILALLDNKDESGILEIEDSIESYNTNEYGELMRFSYAPEEMSLSTFNDFKVITNKSDDKIIRKFYDNEIRLIKKEIFNSPIKPEELELLSIINYFYESDLSPVIISTEEENKKINKKIVSKYLPNGKLDEQFYYKYELESDLDIISDVAQDNKVKTVLECIKKWTYNTDFRLVSFSEKKYFNTTEYTEIKYVYKYKTELDLDDIFYYENNKLKAKTIHNSLTTKVETVFFEDDFYIESVFEDGFKILEIIGKNGNEIRRRSFEKNY